MRRLLDWLRSLAAASAPVGRRTTHCSFCRRSHSEVGPLAEGPGLVFICGACVAVCGRLIAEEEARRAVGADAGSGQRPPDGGGGLSC
jgi:hypothetical protein